MTGEARTFETGIEASVADLPDAPRYWSYSSLKQVEACPRHYSLSRAAYPDLWDQRGYPQAPVPEALFGDVVHGAIELILKALVGAGCSSARSAEAVIVLRSLGGYTAVAERVLAERIAQLEDNPRLRGDQRRRLERSLSARVPDARADIQRRLSRLRWPPRVTTAPSSSNSNSRDRPRSRDRREIADGQHPELELVAESLRFIGRVDVLTLQEQGANITDFKTGAEDPSHHEQLVAYALLWAHDQVVNPNRRPCSGLQAAYPNHDAVFPIPNEAAVRQFELNLAVRIQAADQAVKRTPPVARLSDRCRLCGVRPLCAEYWTDRSTATVPSADGEWFDLEGAVASQHGAKSWVVDSAGHGSVLVRTPSASYTLPLGSSVRLLGVRRVVDPDDPDVLIAAMGSRTETFVLTTS